MNPIVGFLATWIPVGFLLYNFYFTGLHIRSLWNPEKCDSSRGQCLCPAYDNTTQIEFDVYLSRKSKLPSDYDISKYLLYSTANKAPIQLSWNVAPFEETDENVLKPSINATKFGLTKNHTLYGHVIGYYSNKDYPNEDDRYSNIFTYRVIPLIYFDRPRPATYNLYDINSTESKQKNSDKNNNDDGLETKKEIEGLIVPYFVPNITIYYLIHDTCFNLTHIPPETYSYLAKPRSSLFDKPKKSKKEKKKVSARKQLKRIGQLEYYPILFNSDLTHLHKYAIPLMNSYGEWEFDEMLSFLIKIEPISLGFMRLYQTMEQSCRQMERDWEFGKADLDQIKSLFVDINPWLTLATFVAAGLHTIFSFLAMKSDITFWNASDRSLQGLSTNSVVFESISSFVILAYLIDSEQTNKIVIVLMLAECFLGLWKLKRIYTLKQQSQRIAQAKRKRELKKKQKQKEKLKRQKKKKKQKKNKNQVSDDDSDDSDNSDDTTDQDSESEQESGKDETKGKGKEKSKSEEMRKDDKGILNFCAVVLLLYCRIYVV